MLDNRRINPRRKFGYYMRVIENSTSEVIGYLTNISTRGFRLDCVKPLPVNKEVVMRLDLTPDISERTSIIFVARCRWSHLDPYDPTSVVEGYQVINISPQDEEIFNRIVEKYGVAEVAY